MNLLDQRNCGEQHVEAFPWLVEPTDKDQLRMINHAHWACRRTPANRFTVQLAPASESSELDPIGYHDSVASQVLHDDIARRLWYGDACVDLLDCGAQHTTGQLHRSRSWRRGVERGYDGLLCGPQCEQRDARRNRFMNVEYVELAVAQPAAYSRGAHRSEVHSSHRPVVTDWDGCTDAGELLNVEPSCSRV
jgi:hypothetical protein